MRVRPSKADRIRLPRPWERDAHGEAELHLLDAQDTAPRNHDDDFAAERQAR
jgi:hypothetical protein